MIGRLFKVHGDPGIYIQVKQFDDSDIRRRGYAVYVEVQGTEEPTEQMSTTVDAAILSWIALRYPQSIRRYIANVEGATSFKQALTPSGRAMLSLCRKDPASRIADLYHRDANLATDLHCLVPGFELPDYAGCTIAEVEKFVSHQARMQLDERPFSEIDAAGLQVWKRRYALWNRPSQTTSRTSAPVRTKRKSN